MKRTIEIISKICGTKAFAIVAFAILSAASLYLHHRALPILEIDPAIVLTVNPDSAAYLRQFDLAVANFPQMPASLDYYSNYPWGLEYFLPPVWPYLLAALAIPLAAMFQAEPAQAAGMLMLVLGSAIALPIYFLAKELFGTRVGIAAAAIALFHPDYMLLSQSGVDHHAADAFLVTTIFALFFVARRQLREGQNKLFYGAAVLGGILIGTSMLISLSLVLIIGMIFVPVIISVFVLSRDDLKPIMGAMGTIFGVAAAVLVFFALLTPWFSYAFEFSRLSLFHIAVFGSLAAIGTSSYVAIAKGVALPSLRKAVAIVIALGAVAMIVVPPLRETIYSGFLRSVGSYALGRGTTELQGMFNYGLLKSLSFWSLLIFVAPITITALVIKDVRRRYLRFEHLFLYSMLVMLWLYVLNAIYYNMYLSTFMVIIYGLSVSWAAFLLDGRFKRRHRQSQGYNAFLVVFLTISIAVVAISNLKLFGVVRPDYHLLSISSYIKTYTKESGRFMSPTVQPQYGIMCMWGESYQVGYLSQRATVSTGNHDTGMRGILQSERFFQSLNEEDALEIMKEANAKYIVASNKIPLWQGDLSRIHEPMRNPESVVRMVRSEEVSPDLRHRYMAVRLYWGVVMGLPTITEMPLHHIRMIYASNANRNDQPMFLYEVVRGARVVIRGTPDSEVTISTNIKNAGGGFVWRVNGVTDAQGMFSTIAPYSSTGWSAQMVVEPYLVQNGGIEQEFDINEMDVINGGDVVVNLSGNSLSRAGQ